MSHYQVYMKGYALRACIGCSTWVWGWHWAGRGSKTLMAFSTRLISRWHTLQRIGKNVCLVVGFLVEPLSVLTCLEARAFGMGSTLRCASYTVHRIEYFFLFIQQRARKH
jgi:hypothetical protein